MASTWSLATVATQGTQRVAALRPDGVVVAVPVLGNAGDLVAVLDRWDEVRGVLESFDPWTAEVVGPVELLAPLRYPRKVLCSGPNYTDHLAEMGERGLAASWTPWFFLKPPTTTVIGPVDDIPIPADPAAQADWEGELGVVIGAGGRDLTADRALAQVAGYTVVNDVSLRGLHRRPGAPAPFAWDWVASKAADGSLPMGPGIVPAWLVDDPQDLTITTTVNGVTMQLGSTADMVAGVGELVAAASAFVRLEPGDVIATGTPAGVGAARDTYLAPCDVVEVSIEGIGKLRNTVVTRERGTRRT